MKPIMIFFLPDIFRLTAPMTNPPWIYILQHTLTVARSGDFLVSF